MSEINACETPMHDHVRRFWAMLESETVSITVNLRRDTSSVPYWDGSSFSDAVAKALVADRATLSSAAVAGREPVAWQWLHHNSFTGAPMWLDEQVWMGRKSEVKRALYLDPPPTSELEAENARLREELDKALAAQLPQATSDALLALKESSEAGMAALKRAWEAEARLAEALKALEPFAKAATTYDGVPNNGAVWGDDGITIAHLRAARRVREGGKVDG